MTDRPGERLTEEPQEERGAPGSRDKGPAPGGGPTDRPVDTTTTPESSTGVDPKGPIDPEMPEMPPGDQGG